MPACEGTRTTKTPLKGPVRGPRRRRLAGPTLLLLTALHGCGDEAAERLPLPSPSGAVSAGTPEAARAGLDVLARGGNAVDAAVAVSLVLGVTEPSQSGLGGRVVMLIHPAGGTPVVVHVPPRDAATAAGGGPPAPVPGALRVLHHAWTRYGSGRVGWEELVAPAVRAASEGYLLGRFRHGNLVTQYDRILADSAAARLLLAPDRSIPSERSTVTNEPLSRTLQRVGREGAEALYTGELGQLLAQDLGRHGVTVTVEELAAGPAVAEVAPLEGSYRGRTVWVPPDPYGGPTLLAALRFLEQVPPSVLGTEGWVRTAWILEALAYAQGGGESSPLAHLQTFLPMPLAPLDGTTGYPPRATRGARSGETRTVPPPPGRDRAAPVPTPGIRPGGDTVVDTTRVGASGHHEETTHFSVLDGEGTAVSATQTLGAPFGSGRVAEPLGFFYDEGLPSVPPAPPPTADTGAAADSAAPTGGGARAAPADSAALPVVPDDPVSAGTERWSSMVPAMLVSAGRPELLLGSPGGERGLAAVVQVIVRFLDLREPLDRAVLAPRMYVSRPIAPSRGRVFLEGVVWADMASVETAAWRPWGDQVTVHFVERGFLVGERDLGPIVQGLDAWFGGVNAVSWSPDRWQATGDERRDGAGGVVGDGGSWLQGDPGAPTSAPPPAGAGGGDRQPRGG